MTITGQNETFYRDTDHSKQVKVYDADGLLYGSVAGFTVTWKVTRGADDPVAVFTKTQAAGIALDTPQAGWLEITIDRADIDIAPGAYYHELRISDGSVEDVYLSGGLTILGSLTT
jgi:hypothetical protein